LSHGCRVPLRLPRLPLRQRTVSHCDIQPPFPRRLSPGGKSGNWPRQHDSPPPEHIGPKPPLQMNRNQRCIPALANAIWAVIDTHRLPVAAARLQSVEKDPARRLDVKTGIKLQPVPDLPLAPRQQRGDPGHPPTVDLERSQVMAPVFVADLCTDPSGFLITQSPERFFKPGLTACRLPDASPHLSLRRPRRYCVFAR